MKAGGVPEGIVLTGSSAKGRQTDASDLDLVILLRTPAPEFLVSTHIGGRLADVIIAGSSALKAASGRVPPPMDSFASWLAAWLKSGTLLYDPRGACERAIVRIRRRRAVKRPVMQESLHQAWFAMNNNLRHNSIMLRSRDPVYRTALRIRLLYSTVEAITAFFRLRGIAWTGEKAAVRRLGRKDRRVLQALNRALGSRPLSSAFKNYARLVEFASTRRWPRWRSSTTEFQLLDSKVATRTRLARCRRIWEDLTGVRAQGA